MIAAIGGSPVVVRAGGKERCAYCTRWASARCGERAGDEACGRAVCWVHARPAGAVVRCPDCERERGR